MKRTGMHALAFAFAALVGACAQSHEAASPASPGTSADVGDDAAVLRALGGVEWDPDAPAPALRAPSAEPALIRLARGRPGDARVVRVRATMALRHHPTDAVRVFLFEVAAGKGDPEVVAASLDTLARAFGRSHGAEVRALAASRVDDPDPGVRMAAREAIARVRVARWISE